MFCHIDEFAGVLSFTTSVVMNCSAMNSCCLSGETVPYLLSHFTGMARYNIQNILTLLKELAEKKTRVHVNPKLGMGKQLDWVQSETKKEKSCVGSVWKINQGF